MGPYATIYHDDLSFDVWATYGYHRNEVDRNIVFGAVNRRANSHFNAHDGSAYVGSQYDFEVFGGTLSAMASLQYTCAWQEAVRESGAGAISLRNSRSTAHSLRSRLGCRLARSFEALGVVLTPEVRGGWAHECLDDRRLSSHFSGGQTTFTTTSDSLGSTAYGSAALGVAFTRDLSLSARYGSQFSSRVCDQSFGVTLELKF